MSGPVFRSAGSNVQTNTGFTIPTSITPGLPAGYALGDLFIAIVWAEIPALVAGQTLTAPAGWTVTSFAYRQFSGNTLQAWYCTKISTASESAPSFTISGTSGDTVYLAGVVLDYENASETLDAISASSTATLTSPAASPSVTTTSADDAVISVFMGTVNGGS